MAWPIKVDQPCACRASFYLTREEVVALIFGAVGHSVPEWLADVLADRVGAGQIEPWRFLYILATVNATRIFEGQEKAGRALAHWMQRASKTAGRPVAIGAPDYHDILERTARALHLDDLGGPRTAGFARPAFWN